MIATSTSFSDLTSLHRIQPHGLSLPHGDFAPRDDTGCSRWKTDLCLSHPRAPRAERAGPAGSSTTALSPVSVSRRRDGLRTRDISVLESTAEESVTNWPLKEPVAALGNSETRDHRSRPAADSVSSPGQSLRLRQGS